MSSDEGKTVAGIDVSARELVVAKPRRSSSVAIRRFGNAPVGHRALVRWLVVQGVTHVVLEASGIYSLDVALALSTVEDLRKAQSRP